MREPTNVAMEPTSAFVRRGQAVQLTARAYDRDGDEIVGEPFAWESSATAVATINASGLATAVSEGDATITVTTSNGKMATALVDVNLYVVKLAWEGDADLDLHVFGPAYAHASVHSPEIAAGKLMTSAAIPAAREYFSGRARLLGAYYVGVNYYGGTGAVEAQVTVEGIGPEPIVRTYSLTQANQNAGYPVRGNTASWFRPLDVFISGDDISSFGPDTTVPLYDTDPNP